MVSVRAAKKTVQVHSAPWALKSHGEDVDEKGMARPEGFANVDRAVGQRPVAYVCWKAIRVKIEETEAGSVALQATSAPRSAAFVEAVLQWRDGDRQSV